MSVRVFGWKTNNIVAVVRLHEVIFQLFLDIEIKTSVSNSGQNFKTRVSGSWEKKPGKTRVFSGFEMNAILSDKLNIIVKLTTAGPCAIY